MKESATTGIALDGGAMRLSFFGGFLQKIQEEGYPVDEMVGISSGALVALGFMAGFSMQEVYDTHLQWIYERRLQYNIYEKYLDHFDYLLTDEMIAGLNGRLKIVASRLTLLGPRTEVFDHFKDKADLKNKILASGSIPYFNQFPLWMNGNLYVDGYVTCRNPAQYLSASDKLSVLAIREFSDSDGAARLGDTVEMRSFEGFPAVYTFVASKDAIQAWFRYGYRQAEDYLSRTNRICFHR